MVTPRAQLGAGVLAFLVLRLALAVPRTGPVIVADEIGYLTNARVIAGGTPGQLTTAPFYHGGYSVLLAPLLALHLGPTTTYRLVLVVNALLAASLVPLLHRLLVTCFDVPPRVAVWPALAAGAYPSVTVYSQVALSENLLLPLFVLWLLCLGSFVRRSAVPWAAGAAVTGVWLWATHGRMIVAPAVTAITLLASAATRRPTLRASLLGLALIVAGVVSVHALDHLLVVRSYGGHAHGEIDQRLATIESLGGIGAFLRNLVGQAWYLVVAPLGVLVTLLTVPVRRRALRWSSATVVRAALAVTGGALLLESALSFRTVERPDMLVYGRYTEIVVPPLLALALARLAAGTPYAVGPVVAAVVATTVGTVLLRTTVDPSGPTNRWNIASLPAPARDLAPAVVLAAGLVAAVSAGLVALVRRRTWLVAPLVLLLFLPTTAVAERNPVLTAQSSFYPSSWRSPTDALAGVRAAAFDTDSRGSVYVYQWFAPHTRLTLFSGNERPKSRFVFAGRAWGAAHRATLLWYDRVRGAALYRLR
jgi:hypothetical protein